MKVWIRRTVVAAGGSVSLRVSAFGSAAAGERGIVRAASATSAAGVD
jgi:hypothetical protein